MNCIFSELELKIAAQDNLSVISDSISLGEPVNRRQLPAACPFSLREGQVAKRRSRGEIAVQLGPRAHAVGHGFQLALHAENGAGVGFGHGAPC